VQKLYSSRFGETNLNQIASQVCNTVPQDYQDALKKLYDIKHNLALTRTVIAHPQISVSDLNEFVDLFKLPPLFRSIQEELKTMEIWSDDFNKMERLFVD
jgi:hypothetical protein